MAEEQKEVQTTSTEGTQQQEIKTPEAKFTQQDLDHHIHTRLERERQKYQDYDDLKNKLTEYESIKQKQEQIDLEKKQEYDKLKEQWGNTENQYKSLLEQKDNELKSVHIQNSLTNEVLKNNAYPEAVDLIKSQAVLEDGVVKIKGKDSNGIETTLSVEDGVKQFLDTKPYLVKATGQGGSGTAPSTMQGNTGQTQNLAEELQKAIYSGDRQRVKELKQEIRTKHANQGIQRII